MIDRFENVLPDHVRLAALAAFPDADWPWWHRYENGKRATVDPSRIPFACLMALWKLADAVDPPSGFYDLDFYGAGLHLMTPGVSLGKHQDATHHPQRPWRRLSSLVYFLEDSSGGDLLIDSHVINPRRNTAVTFPASKWHEVTEATQSRRTLSLFSWAIDHGGKLRTTAEFAVR